MTSQFFSPTCEINRKREHEEHHTVQHTSYQQQNPSAQNLRQIHIIQSELFPGLEKEGVTVRPGGLGENLTTVYEGVIGLSS